MSTKHYQPLLIGMLLVAIILCGSVFIIPLPQFSGLTAARWQMSIALAASTVTIGATVLFLSGLKQFKTSLRTAYVLLAGGLVLYSLAVLQLPIVDISYLEGWISLWWTNSGLIIVPFLVATVFVYLGMRRYAKLLGIHNLSTSFLFASGMAVLGTALAYVFGHTFSVNHAGFDPGLYPAVTGWTALYPAFAAFLAWQILQRIGPAYKDATRWLFIALVASTISAWHQLFASVFINMLTPYFTYGISFLPLVLSSLLFLRASYAFNLLSIDATNAQNAPLTVTQEAEANDYANSITAVAQLASRVEDIDPLLDDLRSITATMPRQLSPETKQQLTTLYMKLEAYLLHNDPLRSLTVNEIRSKTTPAFRVVLEHQSVSSSALLGTPQAGR